MFNKIYRLKESDSEKGRKIKREKKQKKIILKSNKNQFFFKPAFLENI